MKKKQLKNLPTEELKTQLLQLKQDLFKLRSQKGARELGRIRRLRRNIARLNTLLKEVRKETKGVKEVKKTKTKEEKER